MYAQVNANGRTHTIIDLVLYYNKDGNTVESDDMYITTKNGNRRMWKATTGWKLLILWKDGTQQWITLKLMKE